MNYLKIINILIQFLFIRLTKVSQGKSKGCLYGNYTIYTWYSIQFFVIPLTGWYNHFIYAFGFKRFIRITKKVEIL